jgi:phosphoribosylformylglycinamidine synthase
MAAPDEIEALEAAGRVAFRYCDPAGGLSDAANPNGSLNHIAGVYSAGFNVLGLMPHPENLIDALTGGTDGKPLFEGLAAA